MKNFIQKKTENKKLKLTIIRLWVIFIVILVLCLFSDFLFSSHGHFVANNTFGFSVWYGLGTCTVMIFAAKLFGIFLKRKEDYYNSNEHINKNDDGGRI
ncbi:MAG: hypothetical protein CMM30_07485 [Rhodospirillaceae bacterium]|nr:hypothetical protein [Rhodospirillaceae bacterium]